MEKKDGGHFGREEFVSLRKNTKVKQFEKVVCIDLFETGPSLGERWKRSLMLTLNNTRSSAGGVAKEQHSEDQKKNLFALINNWKYKPG